MQWLIFSACLFLCSVCSADVVIDLHALSAVESGHDDSAYSSAGALGRYQIKPICLRDYNRYSGRPRMEFSDMRDPKAASLVASWYLHKRIPQILRSYGVAVTVEGVLLSYRNGPVAYARGDRRGKRYVSRYLSFLK